MDGFLCFLKDPGYQLTLATVCKDWRRFDGFTLHLQPLVGIVRVDCCCDFCNVSIHKGREEWPINSVICFFLMAFAQDRKRPMPRSWNAALEGPAPLCRPRNPIKSEIGQCVVFKIPSFALYLGPKPMEGEEPYLNPPPNIWPNTGSSDIWKDKCKGAHLKTHTSIYIMHVS